MKPRPMDNSRLTSLLVGELARKSCRPALAKAITLLSLVCLSTIDLRAQTLSPTTPTFGALPVYPAGCQFFITQADLNRQPSFVLDRPGVYCLRESLAYEGNAAALVVRSHDVQIWFLGQALRYKTTRIPSGSCGLQITGIRVEEGYWRTTIFGGEITDFCRGIVAWGSSRSKPIGQLSIRQMQFARHRVAVDAGNLVQSIFESNTFDSNAYSVTNGWSQGTVIRNNTIRMFTPEFGGQWGIYITSTQDARIIENRILGDETLGLNSYPSSQNYGIFVHHCDRYQLPAECGRNTIVAGNILTGLEQGIGLGGSGQSEDNVVRDNQILGRSGYRPYQRYTGPWNPSHHAISASNQTRLIVEKNYIVSGPVRYYQYGIALSGLLSMARRPDGRPALSENETCGVRNPLTIPTGANTADFDSGTNRWEACFATPIPPIFQ